MAINKWFPSVPPIDVSADDWSFRNWFKSLYRWVVGESRSDVSKTSNFTASKDYAYLVDATGGAITVELPLAATYGYKKYVFKKTDASANAVTIQRSTGSSDTIDGATTVTLTAQWDWVELFSDGISSWFKKATTASGGGGSGTVTSITATTPIVVTPSPLTTVGVVSHANSGVTTATYGNATNVSQVTVNATGHVTLAANVAITGLGRRTVGFNWGKHIAGYGFNNGGIG